MFIKRAFYSMKYRKGQNIALIIAYTLIFALTLGLLLVYLSMSSQVDYLQKSLGCAVTMKGAEYFVTNSWGGRNIPPDDAAAFVDSPYVETCNYVSSTTPMNLENGLLPITRDSNRGFFEYSIEHPEPGYKHVRGYLGDCTMVPVSNSRYYDAFTIYGFELVEGTHFTPEDGNAVLISVELAQQNGLKIGDQITFSTGELTKQMHLESEDDIQYATLTICGLFESPNAQEMGYDNETMHEDPANLVISAYDATSGVCNLRTKKPTITWVTVYLKSPSDMEAFLEETQGKLTIERITGSQTGYGREFMSYAERAALEDKYDESPFYTLYLDNEWYETVAKPAVSVRNLMGIFLALVLLGSAIVLALVVVLSLREQDAVCFIRDTEYRSLAGPLSSVQGAAAVMVIAVLVMGAVILVLVTILSMHAREFEMGILLSMGERKRKIILQLFIELLVPILLAVTLSILPVRALLPSLGSSVGLRETVCMQAAHVMSLYGVSVLLAAVSTVISAGKVLRCQPKKIMTAVK